MAKLEKKIPMTGESNVPKFQIKLLSGQNVVLVDCPGYESELFMPQIVEERIIFRNIIPNRCCCSAAQTPSPLIFKPLTDPADGSLCLSKTCATNLAKVPARLIGGKENKIGSTKGGLVQKHSPYLHRYQLNEKNERASVNNIKSMNYPKTNLADILIQLSTQSNSNPLDPNKSIADNKSALQPTNIQNDSGDISASTPDSKEQLKNGNSPGSVKNTLTTGDDWLKVLLPSKPYSRLSTVSSTVSSSTITPSTVKTAFSTLPGRKKPKRPTKPLIPSLKVDIHKRKINIDKKKSSATADLKQLDHQTYFKKKNKKLASAKNRKQLEAMKYTSIDLLTTQGQANASNKLKKPLCKKTSSIHHMGKTPAEGQVQQLQSKQLEKKVIKPTIMLKAVAATIEFGATQAKKNPLTKTMEVMGKTATFAGTSLSTSKSFAAAKTKIAKLSKVVAAATSKIHATNAVSTSATLLATANAQQQVDVRDVALKQERATSP